jgi:hypothetical protein
MAVLIGIACVKAWRKFAELIACRALRPTGGGGWRSENARPQPRRAPGPKEQRTGFLVSALANSGAYRLRGAETCIL